jgi:ABC-type hemin transport system substrate-binding protein
MAKSKITEKRSLSVEGVLNIDEDIVLMEVEEIGTRQLSKLFNDFDGQLVKINISLSSDIEE